MIAFGIILVSLGGIVAITFNLGRASEREPVAKILKQVRERAWLNDDIPTLALLDCLPPKWRKP